MSLLGNCSQRGLRWWSYAFVQPTIHSNVWCHKKRSDTPLWQRQQCKARNQYKELVSCHTDGLQFIQSLYNSSSRKRTETSFWLYIQAFWSMTMSPRTSHLLLALKMKAAATMEGCWKPAIIYLKAWPFWLLIGFWSLTKIITNSVFWISAGTGPCLYAQGPIATGGYQELRTTTQI